MRVLAAGDLEAGLAQAEAQGAANAAFFVKFFGERAVCLLLFFSACCSCLGTPDAA